MIVASATLCTASPYAAILIGTFRDCIVDHVSLNAPDIMSLSFALP